MMAMHGPEAGRDESGVRCMLMRGGTSKGAYFLASDLPADPSDRADLLLRILGSPDPRQVDGIGGAHPLTSKVAVVSASADAAVDVDYLFLQVGVAEPTVSDQQNCGNLLAGVGPFAVERGLVPGRDPSTSVRIRMVNSGEVAVAAFPTPRGQVAYSGDTAISGVPGTAAAVALSIGSPREPDAQPADSRPLFPTGLARDQIEGLSVTCVDAGVPTVVVTAASLGVTGYESPAELETLPDLRRRVRSIQLAAGLAMGLGDVLDASVPKITLVSPPRASGTLCTRSFIPQRCHEAIGVLCAVATAVAARTPNSAVHDIAQQPAPRPGRPERIRLEHPTGYLDLDVELEREPGAQVPRLRQAGIVRTARKLFDGLAFPRAGSP
jgi:4-oxalomesaconate tautomerase